MVEVLALPGGKSKQHSVDQRYFKVGGRIATFNLYESTFDPQASAHFKYLIFVVIRKGSVEVFKCIDFILAPIGYIASQDPASGTLHYMISAIIVTTWRTF